MKQLVGWYHLFNRHEFEQTPRDSEGQGRLTCFSPWVHKELDTSEPLNSYDKVSSVKKVTLCGQHSLAPGNLLAWCVSTKGQTGWEKKADSRCKVTFGKFGGESSISIIHWHQWEYCHWPLLLQFCRWKQDLCSFRFPSAPTAFSHLKC